MKKLLDLRFVIGVFFVSVGVLLMFYHFFGKTNTEMSTTVNIWSGIVYFAFGVFMIVLSYGRKLNDNS